MPEFFWKSEAAEETHTESAPPESSGEAGALQLSVDEFSALEERIVRAVNVVKRERQERAAAEERASDAEAKLREQAPLTDRLEAEVSSLRNERDHVRQRVERLLAQLDALEL